MDTNYIDFKYDIIERVKKLNGIATHEQDVKLSVLFDNAIEDIMEITNRNKEQVLRIQKSVVVAFVNYNYTTMQSQVSNDIASISEGGVTIHYKSNTEGSVGIPTALTNKLNGYKLNKVVNRC